LLALYCFAIPALSQRFTIGAKGGLRLTGDTPQYGVSDSRRAYAVGDLRMTVQAGSSAPLSFNAVSRPLRQLVRRVRDPKTGRVMVGSIGGFMRIARGFESGDGNRVRDGRAGAATE
jgi:hypothetical protein